LIHINRKLRKPQKQQEKDQEMKTLDYMFWNMFSRNFGDPASYLLEFFDFSISMKKLEWNEIIHR
jgi:hypothetical protein